MDSILFAMETGRNGTIVRITATIYDSSFSKNPTINNFPNRQHTITIDVRAQKTTKKNVFHGNVGITFGCRNRVHHDIVILEDPYLEDAKLPDYELNVIYKMVFLLTKKTVQFYVDAGTIDICEIPTKGVLNGTGKRTIRIESPSDWDSKMTYDNRTSLRTIQFSGIVIVLIP